MDAAQGEEKQDEYLVRRILTMNFVSVHTTTMVRYMCTEYHALLNVYSP